MTKLRIRTSTVALCALFLSACQPESSSPDKSVDQTPPPSTSVQPDKQDDSKEDQVPQWKVHRIQGMLPVGLLPDKRMVVSTFPTSQTKPQNSIQILYKSGKVEKTLATSHEGKTIYNSVLADDWVVYTEASNDMIKEDWSITAVKLDGSETLSIDGHASTEIDSKLETPTLIGPHLSASNGKLAFSTYQLNDKQDVEAVLKVYDFKERKGTIVASMSAALGNFYGHPSIYHDLLVYDVSRTDAAAGGTVGKVLLHDLQSGTSKELDSGLNVTSPVLNSTAVVWVKGRDEIKLHDLKSNQTLTISKGVQAWLPSMNETVVTWNHESLVPYYLIPDHKLSNLRNSDKEFGATIRGDLLYWTIKGEELPTLEWVDLSQPNE